MRILTYNVWHGLDGRGLVKRVPFEKPWRVRTRWQVALREISEAKPDLVLLQELNPFSYWRRELEKALSLKSVGTVDNSGLKIYGWGLPVNLQSGLCTLISDSFQIKSSVSLKLSGDRQAVGSHSLQFRESRYGLMVILEHSTWGRGLVINCHLHHGPQWREEILDRACIQLTHRQREKICEMLRRGDWRRNKESEVILGYLSEKSFDWIIWGGDLNADTKSPLYHKILGEGFKDVCTEVGDGEIWTWDFYHNRENRELQKNFCLPLDFKGIGLTEGQESLLWKELREQGKVAKRIDHLFFRSDFNIQVREAHLFATQNVKGYGFKPSDHFGLMTDLDRREGMA